MQLPATVEPINLAHREPITLANHAQVWIRALRTGEERQVRELLLGLDSISWYHRFLSPRPAALDSLVQILARAEGDWGLTLVAEQAVSGSTRMVGLVNVAFLETGEAEVGLLILFGWQRQRLGTELAVRALDAAERRGISRFVAYVGAQNVAARRLLAKVGVVGTVRVAGRMSEYWFAARQPRVHTSLPSHD